jgi:hypothetical protein
MVDILSANCFDFPIRSNSLHHTFCASHHPQRIKMIRQIGRANQHTAAIIRDAHSIFIARAKVDDLDVFPTREV